MDGGSAEQGVACQYQEAHAREAFKRVNFFRIGYQRYQIEAHFPPVPPGWHHDRTHSIRRHEYHDNEP